MIDVLWKLVAHRGANFVISLAVVVVGGSEPFDVRNRFKIPNDDIVHDGNRR